MKHSMINTQAVMPIHVGGAAVCALLLSAGWFFGLSPLMSESQESSTKLDEARVAQEQALLSKKRLEQLTHQVQTMKADLDQKPVSLEPASEINPLMAELAGWADDERLTITRTNAGQPVVLTYYDYVPISLAGEGDFVNLMGLLHRIYAERGDLGVVSFNAGRLQTGNGVSFEIELAWYVLNEQPVAPTVTAQVPTR